MGWLHIAIGIIACLLLYSTENWIAFWVAVVAAMGSFWSLGIMHNFATESAKRRPSYKGGFCDLTAGEANAAPNWATLVNLLFSILSIGLLLYGVYAKFWA
jgi:hypothetical protein